MHKADRLSWVFTEGADISSRPLFDSLAPTKDYEIGIGDHPKRSVRTEARYFGIGQQLIDNCCIRKHRRPQDKARGFNTFYIDRSSGESIRTLSIHHTPIANLLTRTKDFISCDFVPFFQNTKLWVVRFDKHQAEYISVIS